METTCYTGRAKIVTSPKSTVPLRFSTTSVEGEEFRTFKAMEELHTPTSSFFAACHFLLTHYLSKIRGEARAQFHELKGQFAIGLTLVALLSSLFIYILHTGYYTKHSDSSTSLEQKLSTINYNPSISIFLANRRDCAF